MTGKEKSNKQTATRT